MCSPGVGALLRRYPEVIRSPRSKRNTFELLAGGSAHRALCETRNDISSCHAIEVVPESERAVDTSGSPPSCTTNQCDAQPSNWTLPELRLSFSGGRADNLEDGFL
jgi:hypothetical protein